MYRTVLYDAAEHDDGHLQMLAAQRVGPRDDRRHLVVGPPMAQHAAAAQAGAAARVERPPRARLELDGPLVRHPAAQPPLERLDAPPARDERDVQELPRLALSLHERRP